MTTLTTASDSGGDEADRIAAAARTAPGVVAVGGGGLLQPATYLRGRRVAGVRSGPDRVEVSVVVQYGIPAGELADGVRAALSAHARGRKVDVHIADVLAPEEVATASPLELPAGPG